MDFQQPIQQQPGQQPANQQPEPNIQPTSPVVAQPPKNNWKIIVLVIIGVLVLGGASYGAYYYWQNNKPVVVPTADEAANWKNFSDNGASLQAPATWGAMPIIAPGLLKIFDTESGKKDAVGHITPKNAVAVVKISNCPISNNWEYDGYIFSKIVCIKPDITISMNAADSNSKIIEEKILSTFKFIPNSSSTSKPSQAITQPSSFTILVPNGGETWQRGSKQKISIGGAPANESLHVQVFILKGYILADVSANIAKEIEITVPSKQSPGKYKIRAILYDGNQAGNEPGATPLAIDDSDGEITIE